MNKKGSPDFIFVIEFENNSGGMIHSVYELVSELIKYKNILIICPSGRVENIFLLLGVKVVTIGDRTWRVGEPKVYYGMRKIIKKYSDSVFVTNNILSQFIISISSQFIKTKIVYINRGGNLDNKISKAVLFMSGCIDTLITTSSYQKKIVLQKSINYNIRNIDVLSNPVSINEIKKHPVNKDGKCFVIGIVGYIDIGKNQLLAIDALYQLISKGYNVEINIYGEANNKDYLYILKEKIRVYNLSHRVRFKGYESNKDVIYSEIDVLVSTSISEGFGRTIVEAMLYKIPVIALKCAGGPLDIITDNETGFLIDNDACELSLKIKYMIASHDKVNLIVNNAFLMASIKYNPEIIAKSFLSIIN